ncbi:MAG: hypothetical protein NT027_01705 [Proteobacteria bacterium]|nr:hypothetical protein [Pseudomonadota bacterium]
MRRNYFMAILSVSFSVESSLFAGTNPDLSCRVVRVETPANWMEEGLGTYGDPESDSDSQEFQVFKKDGRIEEIKLGQNRYSHQNGDVIAGLGLRGDDLFKIDIADSDIRLTVRIYPSDRGVVLTSEGSSDSEIMATIDCSSVAELEAADPFSEQATNLKKLSQRDISKLPKRVLDQKSKTDVAVELGDGYYGVKSVVTFQVFDSDAMTEVLGYIDVYSLSYSEGDDVTALVRFDRNGLRHGELEIIK